jgi:hypothetical protein
MLRRSLFIDPAQKAPPKPARAKKSTEQAPAQGQTSTAMAVAVVNEPIYTRAIAPLIALDDEPSSTFKPEATVQFTDSGDFQYTQCAAYEAPIRAEVEEDIYASIPEELRRTPHDPLPLTPFDRHMKEMQLKGLSVSRPRQDGSIVPPAPMAPPPLPPRPVKQKPTMSRMHAELLLKTLGKRDPKLLAVDELDQLQLARAIFNTPKNP